MKQCTKCNIEKVMEEFPTRKSSKDGRRNECRDCVNYRMKELKAVKKYDRDYYIKNREQIRAKQSEYYEKKKTDTQFLRKRRHSFKEYWYNKGGREEHRIKEAKRRAQKLNATPTWADLEQIKEIYKNCPEGCHVDHIIPLKSKNVCGLHVPWNLQYLPAKENISKGNNFNMEVAHSHN